MFSPSVYFEMVFPTVFHRDLACGHTHLYIDSSLDWTCREFGFERLAEWWFGTDIVDCDASAFDGPVNALISDIEGLTHADIVPTIERPNTTRAGVHRYVRPVPEPKA